MKGSGVRVPVSAQKKEGRFVNDVIYKPAFSSGAVGGKLFTTYSE